MPASTSDLAVSRREQDKWRVLLSKIRSGRLRFVAPLGEGGTAQVARVHDVVLRRDFALKILHEGHKDGPLRARLLREAQLVGQVHANRRPGFEHVIEVVDMDLDPQPWLLVPFFPGGDLQQHLATFGPMPPRQAVDVTMQVLRGLIAADEEGLVHRDIKPANLFIDGQGRVVIADFGLAKSSLEGAAPMESTGHTFHTRVGVIMGTPWYAAPEQLEDASTADHRADVYSVGVLLLYLLNAKSHPHFKATYWRHKETLRGLHDGVPEVLLEIIHEATRMDRGPDSGTSSHTSMDGDSPRMIRFQHAREMLRRLEQVLPDLPISKDLEHPLGSAMFSPQEEPEPEPERAQFTAVPDHMYDQLTGGDEEGTQFPFVPSVTGASFLYELQPPSKSAQTTQHEFGVGPMPDEDFEDELAQLKQERQAAMRRWIPVILPALVLLAVGGWYFFGTEGASPEVVEVVPVSAPVVDLTPSDSVQVPAEDLSPPVEDDPALASVTLEATARQPVVRETKAPARVEREPEPPKAKAQVDPPAVETIPEPEQPAEPEVQMGQVKLIFKSGELSHQRLVCDGQEVPLRAVQVGASCTLHYRFTDAWDDQMTQAHFTMEPGLMTFSCDNRAGTCQK